VPGPNELPQGAYAKGSWEKPAANQTSGATVSSEKFRERKKNSQGKMGALGIGKLTGTGLKEGPRKFCDRIDPSKMTHVTKRGDEKTEEKGIAGR